VAGIVALAAFDNAVDDAALHLLPEDVGRKSQLFGDKFRIDGKAVLGMANHDRAFLIHENKPMIWQGSAVSALLRPRLSSAAPVSPDLAFVARDAQLEAVSTPVRPPDEVGGRYVAFQMAEIAVPRQMLADILSLIARLRAPPAPARVERRLTTGGLCP